MDLPLSQIAAQVERELRYSPSTVGWKEDRNTVIDRVYQTLLNSRDWPFLVRREPVVAFPDVAITPTRTGNRSFTCTVVDLVAAGLYENEGTNDIILQAFMTGGEVHVGAEAALGSTTNNWSSAPFVIEHVEVSTTVPEFWLEPRASLTTAFAGDEELTIRFPRIKLPSDCAQVQALWDDDGRPIQFLNGAQAQDLLRTTEPAASTPRYALEDAGFEYRLPFVPFGSQDRVDRYHQSNMVVREPAFTCTAGSGGSLPAGNWEVAIAWAYAGRIGPLTEAVEVTTAASGKITVANLPVFGSDEFGRRLRVFLRNADTRGAWYLEATRTDQTVTSLEITSRAGASAPWQQMRYDDEAGPYTYLRLWPRPERFRRMVVEYLHRPRALAEPSDTPILPEATHPVLVWLACQELANRDDERFMKRCAVEAQRYLDRLDAMFPGTQHRLQKGQYGARQVGRLPFLDADNLRFIP